MPREPDRPLDGESIIAAFNAAGVEYVIIGGFAAEIHQAPVPPTQDIDFTPGTDPVNLDRVAEALRALRARIRTPGVPDGVAFDPAPELLVTMRMLNLTCEFGHFDLSFFPDGTDGFSDLDRRAVTLVVGKVEVRVAHLGDVIRSKQAAGRPKDLAVLPALELFAAERGIDVSTRRAFPSPAESPESSVARAARPTSAADARRRLEALNEERKP
jgi:hypothetical protein